MKNYGRTLKQQLISIIKDKMISKLGNVKHKNITFR